MSIGFDERGYDESHLIKTSVDMLKTEHHQIAFGAKGLDEYPKMLYYLEEPLRDVTIAASYKLFEVCHQENLRVVLNGEGSDELLAGYYWHRGDYWCRPLLPLPAFARRLIADSPIVQRRGEAGRRMGHILQLAPREVHKRYQLWIANVPSISVYTLLTPDVNQTLNQGPRQRILDSWADFITPATGHSKLNQLLWLEASTRLSDRIIHGLDRMSMAHSVEARVPFLDHRLWELGARLPTNMKIRGPYWQPTEKYILREATRGLTPEPIRTRKKKRPCCAQCPMARAGAFTRLGRASVV